VKLGERFARMWIWVAVRRGPGAWIVRIVFAALAAALAVGFYERVISRLIIP
jgi:hypothetical protein